MKNKKTNTANKQVNKEKNKSKWSIFYWILGGIFFFIIGSITFISTGYGQKIIIQLVDKSLEQLSIEKISGNLQEGLELKNAQFHSKGINVNSEKIKVSIDKSCLLDYKLCIKNLSLDNSQVDIDTALISQNKTENKEAEINKEEKEPFKFPLKLMGNNVSVNNLKLRVNDTKFTINKFNSGTEIKETSLLIHPTTIDGVTLSFLKQAVTSEQKNTEKQKDVDWESIKETLRKPFLKSAEAFKFPFNLEVPNLKLTNFTLQQDANANNPLIKVQSLFTKNTQWNKNIIQFDHLDIVSDQGNLQANALLHLKDKMPIQGHISSQNLSFKEWGIPTSNINVDLTGELLDKTQININSTGVAQGHLTGSLELAKSKMPFNLYLDNVSICYPFICKKYKERSYYHFKNIHTNLVGDLLDYQLLNARLKTEGTYIPPTKIKLNGRGNLTQFTVKDSHLIGLKGYANLVGTIGWKKGIEWQANANVFNLDTTSMLPQWPAIISGKFSSSGDVNGKVEDKWWVDLNNVDLKGSLFKKKISLKGDVKLGTDIIIDTKNTRLIYGNNYITMNGSLSNKSNFKANINAPDLKGLIPQLKASIKGNVDLTGDISKPDLNLDLIAKKVSYKNFNLNSLKAKGQISAKEIVKGNVDLALSKFDYNKIKVNNAHLTITGDEKDHKLQLTSSGEPIATSLQILGKFDRLSNTWSGYLKDTTIQSPMGKFKNNKNIKIRYDHNKIESTISSHCWKNTNSTLCFPTTFNVGKIGNIPFDIQQVDLNILKPFLAKKMQLHGSISGKGNVEWFKNKAPEFNFEANSKPIIFKHKIDYRTFNLALDPGNLKASLIDNKLNLTTKIKVKNNGYLTSNVVISDLTDKRLLSGNLDINDINLNLLKSLISKSEKIDGHINSKLTFSGSANAPLLNGLLTLSKLKASTYNLPFDISDGNIKMDFNGTNSILKGEIKSPDGKLYLEGSANWADIKAWRTYIKAYGKNFHLQIPNIAKLKVSPNINVTATPEKLNLEGNIDIPFAKIKIKKLPEDITTVSGDEVIIDNSALKKHYLLKKLPKTKIAKNMAINANININIAEEDVSISAYGLDALLHGTIKVTQGNKGLGLYGQVHLSNGTYKSFGQDLIIRKGDIIFSGIPSQPALNIKAIRNPESLEDTGIIAGLKITGMANSPIVKTFSEPQMSKAEVLSYILTGRGLENSGESGSQDSILSAAIGLGLSQGSQLIGNIGDSLGIRDLAITTAGIGEKTQVVVSASLNSRFKVKYGKGIFAPLAALTLRYRLAPQLYLQWISSINQTIDLMYKFKFD